MSMKPSDKSLFQENMLLIIMEELMEEGDNHTFLHLVAAKGFTRQIRALVEDGTDINARGCLKMTPLCLAAWFGRTDACRELLRLGADPRIPDKDGCTPADLARKHWHEDLAAMLDAAERCAELAEAMEAGVTPCP